MAFPTVITASPANIKPAAFLGVYVRDHVSNKFQTIGSIADGVMNVAGFTSPDSLGRNRTNGAFNFTAKCKMKQTSLTELELLDKLCDGTNDFAFKLSDAVALESGGTAALVGWVGVQAAQVGIKAKLVCDGTPENDRYIELEWQGSLLTSELDAALKYTTGDTEFASSADSATAVFYAIGTYGADQDGGSPKNANLKPCGVSTITLADVAGGSAIGMSPIQNVKMSYDMLATQDGIRRFLPNALDINIEYDWMATDNADLLLLDSMAPLNINAVITMLDGVVFTLANQVGIETNFEVSGDMDKARVVRFTHKGKVLQSSFDGIVS
jgi:hypothetical protein